MTDKAKFDYRDLDRVIHSRPRLGIMSVLVTTGEAEFTQLKNVLGLSDGNISVHLSKLERAHYIRSSKNKVGRKRRTRYAVTPAGREAFKHYLKQLEKLLVPETFLNEDNL